MKRKGELKMAVKLMSQDTKDRIRELEGQKIILEGNLEHLSYTSNYVRMVEIENEIFEIEDTIKKLTI
jgi:hypothetical protein